MTAPFVIREQSFAEQIQPGINTLMQALAFRQQVKQAQQEFELSQERLKIAEGQLEVSRGQLQRQKKQDAANLFNTALKFEPDLLQTESGKQLALDAGLNPAELIQQQALRQQRREKWINTLQPHQREGINALLNLADVVDAPSEVRTQIFKSFFPPEVDSRAATIFLGIWRTGAVTAGEAAEAANFPLPEGFPLHLKVPRGVGSSSVPETDRQMQRLSRELGAINTLIDNATPAIERERKRIEKEAGFIERFGQRQYAGSGTEDAANLVVSSRMNAFIHRNFPEFTKWQQRADELQRRMSVLVDESFGREDVELGNEDIAALGQELLRGSR